MKRFILEMCLFCLLLFVIEIPAKGQEIMDHPRIIFSGSAESTIRNNILENEKLKELNTVFLSASDEIVGLKPLDRKVLGRRLLGVSRTYLKRVLWLSYSYRMTGVEKYFIQAEKEMLKAASFSDWNPSHFLDVAEMTAALAIGYDWLYTKLSEESRILIREAIKDKGLLPSQIDQYSKKWLNDVNNWNQVCNAGMVLGALAIYEDEPELADAIIERAKSSIRLPQMAYEPDGAYPEGPTYWSYGTTFNIMLISALQGVPGVDENLFIGKGFMNSGYYSTHVLGDRGYFNYSDNSLNNNIIFKNHTLNLFS